MSENQNRVEGNVWCDHCKTFTTQSMSKIVTLKEDMKVKVWGKCSKCGNYWIKDIPRNEWWNIKNNIRTHYRLD